MSTDKYLFKCLFSLLFINLSLTFASAQQGCFYPYSSFPDKEPVLLFSNYSVIEPYGAGISLAPNEEVIVACPGARNTFLNFPLNNQLIVKCSTDNKLNINGVDYQFSFLNCSRTTTGDLMVTTTSCGAGRGVLKIIGYNITSLTASRWAPLFNVCYDDNRGEALYTQHTMYGSAISSAKKESSRPSFKSAGLGPGVAADVDYKQVTQKATFTLTLGSAELADRYINTSSYLARGHLSPDADFVYVTSQFSTYFYINTVPQWQTVNNGNWKAVETSIRNTAANLGTNLQVITGGYEVLKLKDINGVDQEMYLNTGNKLPVPRIVWKILYSPDTSYGIAFITLNNPFVQEVSTEDIICEDKCSNYGWGSSNWKDASKGFTYCCDVASLKQVVTTIPDINVNGILAAKNV